MSTRRGVFGLLAWALTAPLLPRPRTPTPFRMHITGRDAFGRRISEGVTGTFVRCPGYVVTHQGLYRDDSDWPGRRVPSIDA